MSNVLFAHLGQTIFILDTVPTGFSHGSSVFRLCSAIQSHEPYPTPEPKGKKREALIAQLAVDDVEYHQGVRAGVCKARQTIVESATASVYFLPRQDHPEPAVNVLDPAASSSYPVANIPVVLSSLQNNFDSDHDVQNQLVTNSNGSTRIVFDSGCEMLIPDRCTFIWSSMSHAFDILQAVYCDNIVDLKFDMILIDPPWSNRSVRRARHYLTIEQQQGDPFGDALKFVEHFHKFRGRVSFWITNKYVIRKQTLNCMRNRGFTLAEEWIWVKTTTKGEPVTPLDGVWRKPYEILMIFQHGVPVCDPLRRFIFAVPDLHSRKPSLKDLFDTLFGHGDTLELFARNLTSGWWCIGDEVLKFQDSRSWYKIPAPSG